MPWASMRLARPIKWTEDRQENFYATTQERGQVHDAEMALTRDGRILGVRDTFLFDTGAYDPYGLTIPINTQCTLLGPYDIPNYDSEFTAVFTNKTIVTPVRGAGRQHGVFVSERLLDIAARELGHRSRGDPEAEPARRRIASRTTTRSCSRIPRRSSTTAATTCRRSSRRRRSIGYEQIWSRRAGRTPHAAGRHSGCRHRVLRRRHRHRSVRGRARHRRAERQRARRHRRRHPGPGPLHGVRADRGRRARRRRRRTCR